MTFLRDSVGNKQPVSVGDRLNCQWGPVSKSSTRRRGAGEEWVPGSGAT